MRVHDLSFRIQQEEGDQTPNGTPNQQAVQIWNAIKARDLSTFRIKSLVFESDATATYWVVSAIGDEV